MNTPANPLFRGSMVAIVTPMKPSGDIDLPAWERLLRFHAEQGTDAVIVGGTTGESPALSGNELLTLTGAAVKMLKGRCAVIAGAGTNVTATSVERARALSGAGVDGLLVVTPYYNKPTQEGMFRHFSAVAAASSAPVILYNVPSRTGVDLLPETVARLARVPGIAGIKEATGSVERTRAIVQECPASFEVYSGDDATALEVMQAGARGVISVTANVAPKLMHDFCMAALEGDIARARELDARLQGLHRALFVEANPIPAKWALHKMGIIDTGIRLPLIPLSEQHYSTVLAAMKSAGIEQVGV